MDWSRLWLVGFNAGKVKLVSFDWSKSFSAIDVKIDRFILEQNSSFEMPGMNFSSKLD